MMGSGQHIGVRVALAVSNLSKHHEVLKSIYEGIEKRYPQIINPILGEVEKLIVSVIMGISLGDY